MAIQAIIFDMDGVLFDTEYFYFKRRKVFLDQKGISIDHLAPKDFIGGSAKQTWRLILGDNDDQWDIPKLDKEYYDYKHDHPAPYEDLLFPDVNEVIHQLKMKGYKLALASSSAMRDIEKALKIAKIQKLFDVVLSGEDFPESKPNPAIYQEAIRQLQVRPSCTLVIEDSQKGIEAGKRANLTVLARKDERFGVDQSQANAIIDNLKAIFDYLD